MKRAYMSHIHKFTEVDHQSKEYSLLLLLIYIIRSQHQLQSTEYSLHPLLIYIVHFQHQLLVLADQLLILDLQLILPLLTLIPHLFSELQLDHRIMNLRLSLQLWLLMLQLMKKKMMTKKKTEKTKVISLVYFMN